MKAMVVIVISFWMMACSAQDEHYYRVNPQALQEAIKNCPEKSPKGVSCDELKDTALRMNKLALQLRMDPQDFGKQILALQEEIAKQESELASKNASIKANGLKEKKEDLKERIAIVKWLESPES